MNKMATAGGWAALAGWKTYNRGFGEMPVKIFWVVAVCVVLLGRGRAQGDGCSATPSHIAMTGTFSSQPGVTFALRHFVATLVPLGKTAPECFQKMTVVSRAEIFVSNDSLTEVFAAKLGTTESKIKDFNVHNGVGKVTLTGNLSKVVPIHFAITGPVTTDGRVLLLDAKDIKADGIPIKALLGLVGEHLGNVLKLKGMKGIAVEGNTLSFAPEEIAHLKGYLTGVETTDAGLTLRYGARPRRAVVAKGAGGR